MSAMVSQITGASIVYSSVNSSHKGPVTRKMFPFDDVFMTTNCRSWSTNVRIPLAPTTKIGMARLTLSFDLLTGKWSSPWLIFVPQMNIIHEIGDVTAEWLWGYRPRSKVMGGHGKNALKIASEKSPISSRPQWVQRSTAEGYNKTTVFDTDLMKLTGMLQA